MMQIVNAISRLRFACTDHSLDDICYRTVIKSIIKHEDINSCVANIRKKLRDFRKRYKVAAANINEKILDLNYAEHSRSFDPRAPKTVVFQLSEDIRILCQDDKKMIETLSFAHSSIHSVNAQTRSEYTEALVRDCPNLLDDRAFSAYASEAMGQNLSDSTFQREVRIESTRSSASCYGRTKKSVPDLTLCVFKTHGSTSFMPKKYAKSYGKPSTEEYGEIYVCADVPKGVTLDMGSRSLIVLGSVAGSLSAVAAPVVCGVRTPYISVKEVQKSGRISVCGGSLVVSGDNCGTVVLVRQFGKKQDVPVVQGNNFGNVFTGSTPNRTGAVFSYPGGLISERDRCSARDSALLNGGRSEVKRTSRYSLRGRILHNVNVDSVSLIQPERTHCRVAPYTLYAGNGSGHCR
ncbi:hypothetical protein [Candidatus Anaplasma sp. TIGMIC]|uniref:hypothetical protein n=1 Tax=Candidatus Anaplasma sp. TIGMIC TaxID=3020713 RepID=UPI00232CBB2E|nr:hypothetical protein [Candidatus Anaplasma sp. TIGMIC]MDB1135360.1 hypothetical protein [Candidatus Anaplasma sp. TIGMIC]